MLLRSATGYRTFNLAHHLIVVALWLTVTAHARSEQPAEKADAEPEKLEWQTGFDKVYHLSNGENAKFIPRPFIPERDAYHAKHHPQIVSHPGQYTFRLTKDGKLVQHRWSSSAGDVASALRVADIDVVNLDGQRDVFDLPVEGDWIFRGGANRDAILADVQRELTKATDGRIRVEPVKVEKDVIVARGRLQQKPLEPAPPREPKDIHLFAGALDDAEGSGGGTGSLGELLRHVGEVANQQMINETEPHRGSVSWVNNRSYHDAAHSTEKRDELLKNLAAQTSLEFRLERRTVDVWRVIDTTDKSGGL